MTIRYSVVRSPLGATVIGRTERGVCGILLGDDEVDVVRALAHEFPQARLVRDDEDAHGWTGCVIEHVADWGARPPVPLDLQGTRFQQRVWAALQQVPRGSTVSYGTLARSLGVPAGARAVAGACAGNHLAVLVPCHRAVRADGALGGYRWGIERKRALLEREGVGQSRSEPPVQSRLVRNVQAQGPIHPE
jgi:AraC family transcriptional regulator of adaptative response/methylated-DNA-[protein]-cysteine methyltransferase